MNDYYDEDGAEETLNKMFPQYPKGERPISDILVFFIVCAFIGIGLAVIIFNI